MRQLAGIALVLTLFSLIGCTPCQMHQQTASPPYTTKNHIMASGGDKVTGKIIEKASANCLNL